MAREAVLNTVDALDWVQVAGAIQHPDANKKLDLSQSIAQETGIADASVVLYPTNGYGSIEQIRELLAVEKPDALMLITDPRYFVWLFHMEAEIRKTCPIVYLNIWDDYPAPMYNKPYYASCDALLGISKQTVNINKLVLGALAQEKVIEYIPHGVDENRFAPRSKNDAQVQAFAKSIFGDATYDFVVLFNSRNIRRKQIPDLLFAYHEFLQNENVDASKCALVLHTQPIDENGTDLTKIIDLIFTDQEAENIYFTNKVLSPQEMGLLYNIADIGALLSNNEGWGLMLTECLLSGVPFIANVTGGMQDQMGFLDEEGKWFTPSAEVPSNHTGRYRQHGEWAFPVYPTSRSIQGSVPTPYIYDDRCESSHVAAQLLEAYKLGRNTLAEKGLKGREWALTEAGFTNKIMGQRLKAAFEKLWSTWKPRKQFEFVDTNSYTKARIPHSLYY